jgi:small acid-soluble spore protein D (minor alpha/beta-type SASP)
MIVQMKMIINYKEEIYMSKNRVLVPEAKSGLNKFKMEAAREVGVHLTDGYNGDLTSRENGSVGGQMVKKMVEAYEKDL